VGTLRSLLCWCFGGGVVGLHCRGYFVRPAMWCPQTSAKFDLQPNVYGLHMREAGIVVGPSLSPPPPLLCSSPRPPAQTVILLRPVERAATFSAGRWTPMLCLCPSSLSMQCQAVSRCPQIPKPPPQPLLNLQQQKESQRRKVKVIKTKGCPMTIMAMTQAFSPSRLCNKPCRTIFNISQPPRLTLLNRCSCSP